MRIKGASVCDEAGNKAAMVVVLVHCRNIIFIADRYPRAEKHVVGVCAGVDHTYQWVVYAQMV
jgi:hypothetical protein